jgi:acid stress-induced BolA-like protein IbaG/YrbA
MNADTIKTLLEDHLPEAEVIVRGDDGVHFEAIVISPAFAGKTLLAQHRMVYAALGERVSNQEIHALALKTFTPEAWRERQH